MRMLHIACRAPSLSTFVTTHDHACPRVPVSSIAPQVAKYWVKVGKTLMAERYAKVAQARTPGTGPEPLR